MEKNQEYEDRKRKFHTAVDYISHYEADKKILKLAERRWDIYHILSATKTAIWGGLIFGIILLVCYFVYNIVFVWENLQSFYPILWIQIIALAIILSSAIILLWMLGNQIKWLLEISAYLHQTGIINSKLYEIENWKNIFPNLFPPVRTNKKWKLH